MSVKDPASPPDDPRARDNDRTPARRPQTGFSPPAGLYRPETIEQSAQEAAAAMDATPGARAMTELLAERARRVRSGRSYITVGLLLAALAAGALLTPALGALAWAAPIAAIAAALMVYVGATHSWVASMVGAEVTVLRSRMAALKEDAFGPPY